MTERTQTVDEAAKAWVYRPGPGNIGDDCWGCGSGMLAAFKAGADWKAPTAEQEVVRLRELVDILQTRERSLQADYEAALSRAPAATKDVLRHLGFLEHMFRRYLEVGKEKVAIVKMAAPLASAIEALGGTPYDMAKAATEGEAFKAAHPTDVTRPEGDKRG